jgi:hypothetical protein
MKALLFVAYSVVSLVWHAWVCKTLYSWLLWDLFKVSCSFYHAFGLVLIFRSLSGPRPSVRGEDKIEGLEAAKVLQAAELIIPLYALALGTIARLVLK